MRCLAGIPLTDLSVYRDETKTLEERIDIFLDFLRQEVAEPTKRHRGIGGDIYHEYVVEQIAKGIHHLAQKQQDRSALHALMQQESGMVRTALVVALGNCGDRSVTDELARIAVSDLDMCIREFAVHGLLQCRAYETIPELIQLLSDDRWYLDKDYMTGTDRPRFPVRNQAWIVLKHLGVAAERHDDTRQYTVDCHSAIGVLQKALADADRVRAPQLLSAISRIGGPDARRALRGYVDTNAEAAGKAALVAHARSALSKTPDTTIEERRDKTPLPDDVLNPDR